MAMAQSYPAKPARFVVSFPPGGPNDILGRIVAGWLSQRLGQPFNVEYRDAGQDRDTGPNRPDLVGDPEMGSGDGRTAPYFNVTPIGTEGSAFARPAVGTFGNLERNAYTGPGWWNVDASLFKRFAFGRRALELRFEVQNVFNHVNLGNPDGGIGVPGTDNPNAGMITGVANNWVGRNIQFGARLQF